MEVITRTIFSRIQRHEIYKRALIEYENFEKWGCDSGLCYALYRGMISCREAGLLNNVAWPKKNPCYTTALYPEFELYRPERENGWWWPREDREVRREVMSVLIEFTDPENEIL